jgi:hypothetical protein
MCEKSSKHRNNLNCLPTYQIPLDLISLPHGEVSS